MDSFAANARRRVVRDVKQVLKLRGRKYEEKDETSRSVMLMTDTVSYAIGSDEQGNPFIEVMLLTGEEWKMVASVMLPGIQLSRTIAGVVDMFADQFVIEQVTTSNG